MFRTPILKLFFLTYSEAPNGMKIKLKQRCSHLKFTVLFPESVNAFETLMWDYWNKFRTSILHFLFYDKSYEIIKILRKFFSYIYVFISVDLGATEMVVVSTYN